MLIVIPARGGSKGIPRKNLALCGGMTLLDRAIRVGRAVSQHVIVTTDDDEIAALARQHGVGVRMAYPPKYHGDTSSALDVWRDAWGATRLRDFELSAYLEPTCPERTPEMVRAAAETLRLAPHVDVMVAVTVVPRRYHGDKQIDALGEPLGPDCVPRQALTPRYIRSGAFYIARREAILGAKPGLFPNRRTWLWEHADMVNIDTPADLEEADRRLTAEVAT